MNFRRKFGAVTVAFAAFWVGIFPFTLSAYVGTGSNTVLLLHFNEGDGENVYDESSSTNDGFRGNSAGNVTFNPAWIDPNDANANRFGNALDYDGTNDFTVVPDDASLDITTAITLEAWINPDDVTSVPIISKWGADGDHSYHLSITAGSQLTMCLNNPGTGGGTCVTSATTLTADQLAHVAGSWDGTTMRLYINGTQDANTTAFAGPIRADTSWVTIGGQDTDGDTDTEVDFNGSIDEVRILSDDRTGFNGGAVINTVTFNPAAGSDTFVFYNGGGATLNLGNRVIEQCSSTNTYTIPTTGTRTIAAGATVTVTVGAGTDTATNYFTCGLACGAGEITALANDDCLRVYNSATTDASTIIDFVAWGDLADTVDTVGSGDDEAVDAGLWRADTYVSTLPEVNQRTIQLFITAQSSTTRVGDNEEGVLDWLPNSYLFVRGEDAPRASGDYYSANNGGGRNTDYEFYIEVPTASPTLRVELFDADIGNGDNDGADEVTSNRDRDQNADGWATPTTYTLINPSGTTVATFLGDDTVGTDNSFMTPNGFLQTSPATGTWTVRVLVSNANDGGSQDDGGDEINTYTLRAEGFQIKTNYLGIGDNVTATAATYLFYPWIKSGCDFDIFDFDSDGANTTTQQILFHQIYGTNTFSTTVPDASLSGNDVWEDNTISGYTNDEEQTNYGPVALIGTIIGYGGGGNYVILETRDYTATGTGDAGDADTDTKIFPMYLPVDNGGPPNVPYIIQFYEHVSGPVTPTDGSTTRIRIYVVVINLTGTSLTTTTVTARIPGTQVVAVGPTATTITQGSITSEPAAGGSGDIIWNVGTITGATTGVELQYQVDLTPNAGMPPARKLLTGSPGSNGTRATYTSAHSSAETIGHICELAATVGTSIAATYVSLTDFAAIPYQDAVLLEWQTGTEIDNLGFNVYRSEEPDGHFVQINSELILGLLSSAMGGNYYFIDHDVEPGKTYYYMLEDIDLFGVTTQHGPVSAAISMALGEFGSSGFDPGDYTAGDSYAGDPEIPQSGDTGQPLPPAPGVQIEEVEDGLVIELYPTAPDLTAEIYDGDTYWRVAMDGYTPLAEACTPQTLVRNLLFAVPNRELTFSIDVLTTSQIELPAGQVLWPQPEYQLDESGTALVANFCLDDEAYSTSGLLPSEMTTWLGAQWINQKHLATLRISPIQYNPSTNTIIYAERIRARITFGEVLADPVLPVQDLEDDASQQLLLAGNPQAFKIRTEDAGVYRLEGADLIDAGLDSSVDPRLLKLFYRGREQAILIAGEEDGILNNEDAVIFYAQENSDTQAEAPNTYWLVADEAAGLRMAAVDSQPTAGGLVETYYWEEAKGEENHYYYSTIPDGEGKDHWFWSYAVAPVTQNFAFEVSDLALAASEEALLEIALQGVTNYPANPDHHVRLYLNGELLADETWDGQTGFDGTFSVPLAWLTEGANQLQIELPGDLAGVAFDAVYLNHFKLSYPRHYHATGGYFALQTHFFGNHQISALSNADVLFIDVTNPEAPALLTSYQVSGDEGDYTLSFRSADHPWSSQYVLATADGLKTPMEILPHSPSYWHDPANEADYLILAPGEFLENLAPLQLLRELQGHTVLAIDVAEIYDEFGFGVKSPAAIRQFLRYTTAHWATPPRYILLAGDGSYDPKKYLGSIAGNDNWLPTPLVETTFMQVGSDHWYSLMDDQDLLADVMLGRLPADNTGEITRIVERIVAYESLPADQAWEKNITLIQDDVEAQSQATDSLFGQTITAIEEKIPDLYQITSISEESSGGVPQARENLVTAMNAGSLVVNYVGHGSINLWAAETLFQNADVSQLNNLEHLPIVLAMNCLNSFYFFPGYESLSESMLFDGEQGGVIAFWSSSGLTTPDMQMVLNTAFYEAIFGDHFQVTGLTNPVDTLGEAVNSASLALQDNEHAANVLKSFTLIGDPALRLKVPPAPVSVSPENPGSSANTNLANAGGSSADSTSASGCSQSNAAISPLHGLVWGLPLLILWNYRRKQSWHVRDGNVTTR